MNVEKKRFNIIYILSIFFCLYLAYIYKVDISFDSPSYIDAWSTFKDGNIDKWRTPIYPLFLGLLKIIFGNNYLYYVVGVQHFIFLISIRYFYLLLCYFVTNEKISYFLTLFYALYPCVATYNCCILTETLGVSGCVFLLYSILSLYNNRKFLFGLYTFFWLFFFIFLRPAAMYLLPVTFVFWCMAAIKRRSLIDVSVVYGMFGTVVVSILLLVYMALFNNSYGIFAPTGIGLINKYAIAEAADVIDYNITGKCEQGYYRKAESSINTIGMEAFSDSLNQSINRNKGKYIKRLWQNFRNASEYNLFDPSYPEGFCGIISNIMGPKVKSKHSINCI